MNNLKNETNYFSKKVCKNQAWKYIKIFLKTKKKYQT